MLPPAEIPSPIEIYINTIGKVKLVAASAAVWYWPNQNVSARL
jgi:hypothetical protein